MLYINYRLFQRQCFPCLQKSSIFRQIKLRKYLHAWRRIVWGTLPSWMSDMRWPNWLTPYLSSRRACLWWRLLLSESSRFDKYNYNIILHWVAIQFFVWFCKKSLNLRCNLHFCNIWSFLLTNVKTSLIRWLWA